MGILLVDKPSGITSHDVVNTIRRRFQFKKVGHAGTLDPMATGLLIILIEKATKKCSDFINDDKTYKATLRLGVITDTGDAQGAVLEERPCTVREDSIRDVIEKFKGEMEQIPPMFSAKKQGGKRLYQYARKGINVVRKPRKITIRDLRILDIHIPNVSFELTCSKGTYVRQLAVDIGEVIGCGAHITALRRIKSGKFDIGNALDYDKLKNMTKEFVIQKLKESTIPKVEDIS